jgi:serine/threonine-protein kinase
MSAESDAVAAALPSYEVGEELGRGGWGVVLAGRHRQLDRNVAIKQLPRSFAADETVRKRFFVEAKLMASLDHPHIVPVYDFVEQDGLCLLVLELLPGGTVWSRFTADGFTPMAAAATGLACLAGLQAAHTHNFLHRDIKPENLMFSANGVLKVTDFGIAKMIGGDNNVATRAGEVIGTPAYIAPEQARGGDLSPATDIYAVATMLYELFSGVLPFTDDGDAMSLLFKHAFEPPTSLAEKSPQTPVAIADVVMSGLATDPAERPASAEEFGLALARACTASWGPGWLTAEGSAVMGAGSIVAATEGNIEGALRPATPSAPVTGGSGPAAATGLASAVEAIPPPPPGVSVRPPVTSHASGPDLADLDQPVADLVPLRDVVVPPPSSRVPLMAAAALFVVALLLAFVGLGSPSLGGSLHAGDVGVNGTDPASGRVVSIDLARNVPVGVSATAPQADHVRLTLSLMGQKVASGRAVLAPSGASLVSVPLGGHFLLGGQFTGTISLLRGGQIVGTYSFKARTSQTAFASVTGAAPFILLLFVLAYSESILRTLRRGKKSVGGIAGLTVIGALIGVDIVGIAWVLAHRDPTTAGLLACAILGAASGFAAGLGAARVGRQRRYKRAQRRERRLGAA